MPTLQVPPGRMGRVWLIERLQLAERGVVLLEEKLRLLDDRLDALRSRVEETRRRWHTTCGEADAWGLRATLVGGERAVALATPGGQTAITVEWAMTTGIRYPERVRCTFPPEDDAAVVHTGSATVRAAQAHRAAVVAAAHYAAAVSALATVEREVAATRLRARALSNHWLPTLQDALARINLELEEQDLAEATRLRLVQLGRGSSAHRT